MDSGGSPGAPCGSNCSSSPFILCFFHETEPKARQQSLYPARWDRAAPIWAPPMLKRMPWPVILQIVPELSAGGAERTTIEMAEAITLAGGRALVVSAGGRLEDELAEAG